MLESFQMRRTVVLIGTGPGGETPSSRSTFSGKEKSPASDTVPAIINTGSGATGAGGSEYALAKTAW